MRYFSLDGETEALRDINISVAPGEFVAIIGQSGCGKSTLLSLISGSSAHRRRGPARRQDGRRAEPQGRLHASAGLSLRVAHHPENAVLGAEIQGADMGKARVRQGALTKYGLGQFLHHLPRQLSGGMRQRVALARTLCTEPEVVLLDEPFSALDSQTRLALADEVTEILRREGKTTILVTHDIAEAISMTERVIVLAPARADQVRSSDKVPVLRRAPADPFQARNARSSTAISTRFGRSSKCMSRVEQLTLLGRACNIRTGFRASGARA
jgi:NitT/TauT family transport system ATP-binding protein